MKQFLRLPADDLIAAWKTGLAWDVKRTAIAFLLIWGIAFCAGTLSQAAFDAFSTAFSTVVDGMQSIAISRGTPALMLFLNNIQATAAVMLYGLIPFLRLGALSLGLNAALLGWMGALYVRSHLPIGLYFAALIPHAIFELPALILALAMSLYVCGQLSRRLRGDETALSWVDSLCLMGQTLFFPLFPLLLAAACMEAYVTPAVASLFLSSLS